MQNTLFVMKELMFGTSSFQISIPSLRRVYCACVDLIYFCGTQTARAAFCTSIARISPRRSSENYISPSGKYPPGKLHFVIMYL